MGDEADRERVWARASRRMVERCGRTAVGDVERRWAFGGGGGGEAFALAVREPALTGDWLGLKTWASAYVLARHLPRLAASSSSPLSRLFDESLGRPRPRALELGSGTGLLGLAAAALWRVPVALSDLPAIVPNLKHNVDANAGVVGARGGSLAVGALTWGSADDDTDQALFGEPFQFQVSERASLPNHPLSSAPGAASTASGQLTDARSSSPPTRSTTTTTRRCWRRPSAGTWRWGPTRAPSSWCRGATPPRRGCSMPFAGPCWTSRRRCSATTRTSWPGRTTGWTTTRPGRCAAGWACFRGGGRRRASAAEHRASKKKGGGGGGGSDFTSVQHNRA